MSLDGNDSGAVWQDPNSNTSRKSFNQSPHMQTNQDYETDFIDSDQLPPPHSAMSEDAMVLSSPAASIQAQASEIREEEPEDKATLLSRAGQYLSLVLAPVLFGGLTCLFVLPLIATGHAKLPPEGMWPIALIIIAIAVGQGVAVYYSGANNGLWAVSTLGAFFLYVLVGCFAIFGGGAGIFLTILFIILIVVLARLYVHPVAEGNVDIVYALGKYSRTLYSGFNILLPWEKVVRRLNVAATEWVSPVQRVQMSRDEDVVLRATISYQLMPEDAYLAITQVNKWEESLRELFVATIQTIATMFTPEDLLVWQRGLRARTDAGDLANANNGDNMMRWEKVNTYLYQQMLDKVALWGVQVNWVRVRDITLTPHGAVIMDITDPAAVQQPLSDAGAVRGAAASVPAQQIKLSAKPTAAPSAPPPVSLPANIKDEDLEKILVKAYREVQSNKITDPDTIRSIAAQFEAIANDPEKSKHVSFDAERAARNLYEQANTNELQFSANSSLYNDDTKTDWSMRRPTDENMMAGG